MLSLVIHSHPQNMQLNRRCNGDALHHGRCRAAHDMCLCFNTCANEPEHDLVRTRGGGGCCAGRNHQALTYHICFLGGCSLRRRVEDFELHKELYRGKTSLLYMATDKKSGTQVALKLYRKRKLSTLNRCFDSMTHIMDAECSMHQRMMLHGLWATIPE